MTHPKHDEIKAGLGHGLTVRQVAKALHISTKTVQVVRAQYPEEFEKRGVRGGGQVDQPAQLTVKKHTLLTGVIFGRVRFDIFERFKCEMRRRGFSVSELLRSILSERYRAGEGAECDRYEHENEYAVQSQCACPADSIIKNCNSNLDRDEVVCGLCGRVGEGDFTLSYLFHNSGTGLRVWQELISRIC